MFSTIFHPDEYRIDSLFFSKVHIVNLLIFVIFCILLYAFRNRKYVKSVRWLLLSLLILSEISLHLWSIHYGTWNIRFNLPLNLCSISIYLCAYMLLTKSYRVFEIVYFIGIGGAFQALLTPDLLYTFPHYRFFHFFIAHMAIIITVFYMIWVYKYKITFTSLLKAFFTLNVLAFIVIMINMKTGANYMYLARKPEVPSLLDFLGPYPWYIISLEIVAFLVFLLLYLPFFSRKKRSNL